MGIRDDKSNHSNGIFTLPDVQICTYRPVVYQIKSSILMVSLLASGRDYCALVKR